MPATDRQEEIRAQREEIVRLKHLLIARDLELGEAKGRVAELELRAHRLGALATRLPAPFARPALFLRRAWRRLRGKR